MVNLIFFKEMKMIDGNENGRVKEKGYWNSDNIEYIICENVP